MARYIKKPVVIDAFRLGIDNIPDWFMDKLESNDARVYISFPGGLSYARIKTLTGTRTVEVGDFIIKGIDGELSSCKADFFYEAYDRLMKPEAVNKNNTMWIEQIIQEGKRRNEIPLAKILMKKGD